MDITPYVASLRRDLVTAAEAGSDDIRAAAERLAMAIDPAARLVLMEALSDAASQISAELPQGSVEVRLAGREVEFVVDPGMAPLPPAPPAPPLPPTPPTPPPPPADEDGDTVSRVSLRLPEALKLQAEARAADAGQSLNTWLVTAVRHAAQRGVVNVDIDLSSLPLGTPPDPFQRRNRRMTGWS